MSAKLSITAEQDDAAFRARLAPLASEVLPPSSAAATRTVFRPSAPPAPGVPAQGIPAQGIPDDSRLAVARAAYAQTAVWPGFGPPGIGRRVLAVSAAVASAAVLGLVWSFSRRPGSNALANAPAPATPPSLPLAAAPSENMIGLLLRRGDAALADGDIIAARLLYERAAAMGSAKAATSAGKTYDVDFLARSGARGIRPDQTAAAAWFRKAAVLGDPEARSLLARIEGRPRP